MYPCRRSNLYRHWILYTQLRLVGKMKIAINRAALSELPLLAYFYKTDTLLYLHLLEFLLSNTRLDPKN
jgi:hypothetical protein